MKEGRACVGCLPGRLGRCCDAGIVTSVPAATGPVTSGSITSGGASQSSSASARPFPSNESLPSPAVSTGCSLIDALPSLDSILRLRTPTLHHVPKGARDLWASLLGEVLGSIISSPSDVFSWCRLFMLAKCILANPPQGGRSHWRDTLKLVRSRIQRWKEGDIHELWSEVVSRNRSSARLQGKSKCVSSESMRRSNASRARRAVEDGQYRKAIQSLTSVGLAQASADIANEMLAKHPQANPPHLPPDPVPPPVQISERVVVKALRSFPSGTAPGPSGLRANHLKEAVFCPSPDRANFALRSLTSVVSFLCTGKSPPDVTPHLCGASLFACKKKDGGFRPIAVGEVLRRLTSKCISRAVHAEASSILSPLQVGVGIPNGCEAIIHAVVNLHEDTSIPPESRFTLLVDFFNLVDRKAMFQEVRARIPSMAAWIECCYGSQPILRLGDHSILSCCGVQQGDPLGPLGFALALHPIIETIKEEVPGLLINAWYLDDGTLSGSLSDLSRALAIIESEGPSRGLFLNRAKSLLHSVSDTPVVNNPLLVDIPITTGGFDLLGSPVGSAAHCEASVLKRVNKVQEILTRLSDLQDSQMETTLLRSCLALPKVAHVLRTCPPGFVKDALVAYDEGIRDALSDIAGSPLSDWAWLKASLPSSFGGLNIRRASLHAPAAYIGSLHQTTPLVSEILGHFPKAPINLSSAISALALAAGRPEWCSSLEIDVPLHQRHLSHAIDEASYSALLAQAPDARSRALALSSSIRHAGDWFNVIPSSALGLHLQDREFRLCLQYWLGLRMSEEGARCRICHAVAEPFGDHQVGCGGNGDRIHRHDSIRDAVFSAAQSAALAPRREVPSLIPDTRSRPADIFLPNWKRGRPAALDVTVISTLQQLTIHGAASMQGHAL